MADQRILASSALMAAGTVVSRLSGFVRSALLVLALGEVLRADLFSIANTIPNMVYILVAGGIFNAVLVPQMVRRIKDDADGGDAYGSRVITLSALFLAAVTVLLVVFTPQLLDLYLSNRYDQPDRAAHLESLVDLTRWCLPQVFFYGMFVLLGQILNARESFGPMMWAPIANNVVAVAMLVTYLFVWGPVGGGAERYAALSGSQEVLLGLGSTIGIAIQFLVLLPYLRRTGFTFRPRYDFRDPELRHTLSLGVWTVLFVVVTQLAYLVVVRLASGGTAAAGNGTGYTIYSAGILIMMVPHAVVTVSLATAILPRISLLAHEERYAELGSTVGSTLRTALSLVLPFAVLLPVLAGDVATFMYGWDDGHPEVFVPTIQVFGPALVFFTVHYFMLRGFYSLEDTRTVFFIQCLLSLTNVGAAIWLVRSQPVELTAPMLATGYLLSYVVGSGTSFVVLRRRLGGLEVPELVRFVVRMALALALAAAAAWGVRWSMGGLGAQPWPPLALLRGGLSGLAGLVVVLVAARAMRISEVTSLVDTVSGRVRRR